MPHAHWDLAQAASIARTRVHCEFPPKSKNQHYSDIMATSLTSARGRGAGVNPRVAHEGVNVISLNQEGTNKLMENAINFAGAADAIIAETAVIGVKQVMLIMLDMIRLFVRKCVDV